MGLGQEITPEHTPNCKPAEITQAGGSEKQRIIESAMRHSRVFFAKTAKEYAEMWPDNAHLIHPSIFFALEQQGLFCIREACFTIEGQSHGFE